MGRPLPPPFWDDLDAVEPLIYLLAFWMISWTVRGLSVLSVVASTLTLEPDLKVGGRSVSLCADQTCCPHLVFWM